MPLEGSATLGGYISRKKEEGASSEKSGSEKKKSVLCRTDGKIGKRDFSKRQQAYGSSNMRTVWHRVVRPAIGLGSSIILAFLVIHRGRLVVGNGDFNFHETHRQLNLQGKTLQVEVSSSSSAQLSYIGDGTSRGGTRLLGATGEDELTGKGTDVRVLPSQELIYKGDSRQPLELSPKVEIGIPVQQVIEGSSCTNARAHPGYTDSCSYVKATSDCKSGALIEYTKVFYCFFSGAPILAYIALTVWLACLFYMLGHTAAEFFCSSLENLSRLLHLPPTLAGAILLPFGNGAPDVFAGIAAFVGSAGKAQVGLNSVLGGAMFVSSVVAGSATLVMTGAIHLDQECFLRDIGFFLFTLAGLTTILFAGKIHFWQAAAYTSIYVLYAATVALVEYLKSTWGSHGALREPLLSGQNWEPTDNPRGVASEDETLLPQRMLALHVDIYRQASVASQQLWGDQQEGEVLKWYTPRGIFTYFVHWPLTIPRRFTIPLVKEDGWSKFYAVCSATFAPSLLAFVWDGIDNGLSIRSAWVEYLVAGSVGIVLGGLSLAFLKEDRPPQRYRLLWECGGFIMSMVWSYIIADELVAALVALGAVLEIDPAILGLTVLAWGNSVGDLMSNLALVSRGNNEDVQTAFSGCHAGPMFNTLMGVGLSFGLASWKTYPAAFVIPEDKSIFITLAFLVVGLVWTLIMLLSRNMQPTKSFAIGLLILYFSFLTARLAHALDVESFIFDEWKR